MGHWNDGSPWRQKGFGFVVHWLVGVEIHNHCCKTLHAYGQNEMTQDYQSFGAQCQSKFWTRCINPQHPCQPWDWQLNWKGPCMDGAKYTSFGCEVQGPTPLHTLYVLHVWMDIVWKLVQAPSGSVYYMYWFHTKKYYSLLWELVWI